MAKEALRPLHQNPPEILPSLPVGIECREVLLRQVRGPGALPGPAGLPRGLPVFSRHSVVSALAGGGFAQLGNLRDKTGRDQESYAQRYIHFRGAKRR